MNDTTAAAVTSRADVPTDQPARYVKQLISHLGRKLDVTTDGPGRAGSLRRAAARSTPWALAGADDRALEGAVHSSLSGTRVTSRSCGPTCTRSS